MVDNCFVVNDRSIIHIKPEKGVATEIGVRFDKFVNHRITSFHFVEADAEPSTNRIDGKTEKQINLIIIKVNGKELVFKNITEGYARVYPVSKLGQ